MKARVSLILFFLLTDPLLHAALDPLELVSPADPNQGSATAGAFNSPQLNQRGYSADGRYVVYLSAAENLIPNLQQDRITTNVYTYDRVTQQVTLVSHAFAAPNKSAGGSSFVPTISSDGRFVVYWNDGTDLIENQVDEPSTPDVFIWDRTTNTNRLVSHLPGQPNVTGDSNSYDPTVNEDGRYVTFTSAASNLVVGQTNGGAFSNIFTWDRETDALTLITHKSDSLTTTGEGSNFNSIMSNDGAFVAFLSNGGNFVPGQTQPARRLQVFLWTRATNQNVLVSHAASSATTAADGAAANPIVNADGSFVAYYHAGADVITNQVDGNQTFDVFIYERASGTNTLVSHIAGNTTTTGSNSALFPQLSADARYLTFQSTSASYVANDLNNAEDVFIWDRTTNTNTLVSRSATSDVSDSANAKSFGGKISADGTTLTFTSNASDLFAGQAASGNGDVFLRDRASGEVRLLSHPPGSPNTGGDQQSVIAIPSANGQFITFNTQATTLVANDTNGSSDVFIHDRGANTNTCASLRSAGLDSLTANGQSGSHRSSADGRFVVFISDGNNLAPNQTDANNANDIFLRDRQTQTTILVSHAADVTTQAGDNLSDTPSISADGRWITYASRASDLAAGVSDVNSATGLNGGADVFLYDRETGTNTLVSRSATSASVSASDSSFTPALSADGRYVVFTSLANDIVIGQLDNNADTDLFVFDRMTGLNTLVSHGNGTPNTTGTGYSFAPAISNKGRLIAYYSSALNLVPNQSNTGDSVQHLFLYDRAANSNAMIDHQPGAPATSGDLNAGSTEPRDPPVFSADGNWIVYASDSTNLVAGQLDANNDYDIFLYERATDTNLLVSHQPGSLNTGSDISYQPTVSADGRLVSYRSQATNLVAGQDDTQTFQDVFLFDRLANTNTLVSHAFGQPATTGEALGGEAPRYGYQSVSPDGRFVAHWNSSGDIIPGYTDQNGFNGDLYLFERSTGQNVLVSHAVGLTATGGNNGSGDTVYDGGPIWSADGLTLLFGSRASNLFAGDFNSRQDIFALTLPSVMKITSIARLENGRIALAGTGVPSRQHTLQFSPDLSADSFTFLAPITPNENGTWQHEDAVPAGTDRRFYRLTLP